ncbi:CAF17-like 4Fe-4S cluster assembly/insertion protein YgfZ [Candidatus Mycalebacterium sp.]
MLCFSIERSARKTRVLYFICEDNKNFNEEYRRARDGCALFDLSGAGKLFLKGKDHLKFLQSILTNDVLKPAAGQGVYSLMLNRKGRVLCDMNLFMADGGTLIDITNPDVAARTQTLMDEMKLSYRVEIERKTRHLVHIAGPSAEDAVSEVLGREVKTMKPFDHFETAVKKLSGTTGGAVWAARCDRTGLGGFDIEANNPEVRVEIEKQFASGGVLPASTQTFDILRMEAGIPEYGKDMDESVIAPETGLENAISFDKGCYVGQEIVARAHWRGRVNRRFSGFLFDGRPSAPGEIVSPEGTPIGRITSSGFSPDFGAVALGYIRREYGEPGTAVKTGDGHEGKVAELPLAGAASAAS